MFGNVTKSLFHYFFKNERKITSAIQSQVSPTVLSVVVTTEQKVFNYFIVSGYYFT